MSIIHDVTGSIRRRITEASRLGGPGNVAVAFYDSLLRYFPRLPLPFRGRMYRMSAREEGLACWVRLGFSDGSMFEDICIRGIYDSVRRAGLSEVRQVVDLGANVGVTVRLWAHLFPNARIVAVEPDAMNLEVCRRNIAPNEDRITLMCAFAAGKSGVAYLNPGSQACTHTMSVEPVAAARAIPAYTLPEICEMAKALPNIDLLKCDIEGSERELFADCAGWIDRVRHLMIELHPPYTAEDLLNDLRRGGSAMKVIWTDCAPEHPLLFLG